MVRCSRLEGLPERLSDAGVQPSAQRLAIGEYVLATEDHPSADEVLDEMERRAELGQGHPKISRATVYNTLNLFVEKGLLRELIIEEGHAVFDPRLDAHHHFVDTESGEITDLPLSAVPLGPLAQLDDYDVEEIQVVLRGTRRRAAGRHDRRSKPPRRRAPS